MPRSQKEPDVHLYRSLTLGRSSSVQTAFEAMGKVQRLGPEYKGKAGVFVIYRQVHAFLKPQEEKKEIRAFCGPFSSFDSLWQRYFRFHRKDERRRMRSGMSKVKAQRE